MVLTPSDIYYRTSIQQLVVLIGEDFVKCNTIVWLKYFLCTIRFIPYFDGNRNLYSNVTQSTLSISIYVNIVCTCVRVRVRTYTRARIYHQSVRVYCVLRIGRFCNPNCSCWNYISCKLICIVQHSSSVNG